MADSLLNRLLNDEEDVKQFCGWLFKSNDQDKSFKCSRSDFTTYFLNFVHEEAENACSEAPRECRLSSSGELNKSHSFPLDLSSEQETADNTSTPKITRVSSECFLSPLSPIHNGWSTPKTHKSPICLGDFIVNKRTLSKKKSSRRIKPTDLSQQKTNGFHKSENSFSFDKSEPGELPSERNELAEERLRVISRGDLKNVSARGLSQSWNGAEVKADACSVRHKQQLDRMIQIYLEFLRNNFILNVTSEVYFLISLLLKKQFYGVDWGIDLLVDKVTASQLFASIHNVVYFAAKSLDGLFEVLKNYDKSTIRLLIENERLREFSQSLVDKLRKVQKSDRTSEVQAQQPNVCFNLDTDNRQNFPNDPSFHAFRKQRDLFYEILRLWEQQRLAPGFGFAPILGVKVRNLVGLHGEPTNFVHFARLFKSQLLSTCRGDCENFVTALEVDAQKLSKLRNRCVSKGNSHGLNAVPGFSESEEFYREFLVVAGSPAFNRHFADCLVEEITELNDTNFENGEFDGEEYDVDFATKRSYSMCVQSLGVLAKFLGFVESLPYKTDLATYSEHLLATHLKIRHKVSPNFDVRTILQRSIERKTVILCIPWLVKYLSVMDVVTLKLPYYTQLHNNLFWLYRKFDWGSDCNIHLVRCCLGWLFELPHVPDNNYLRYCEEMQDGGGEKVVNSGEFALDRLNIADQDVLYACCPYLEEIKKLLSTSTTGNAIPVKHITPVTALQSPDEVARKRLEQQLEEAFFNGQPISLRKTVEFVSERVASTCVKFICATLVPNYKQEALGKFKRSIADVESEKVTLKSKASEFAAVSARELQLCCEHEATNICNEKVSNAVDSLVSLDILPRTKEVCVGIARKLCIERVRQWIGSHVTSGIFSKDFNEEILKVVEVRKSRRPIFVLPPGGTNDKHDQGATSAAHLLGKFANLSVMVVERRKIADGAVVGLLDETLRSIRDRGDINQCILATLCTQLLDLHLVLLAHDWTIMLRDGVLSKSRDIWRLYYNGCDDLFKSLLCPRSVKIFSRSWDLMRTWNSFAKFCVNLIENKMLSCENFESQCTGIFKTYWDEVTLKCITEFFKAFVRFYGERVGKASDFTFLLGFLSDYCEDL